MNPQELFCPNMVCPARGQTGKGNVHIHSRQEKRCICDVCGQTFATTKGTIFYRLRSSPQTVMCVIVLMVYECPLQAIAKAFLLDERTVCDWQKRAGQHCQQVHEHLIKSSQHDLEQVQADEIKAKTQRGTLWMAFAIWVPTRLWMGGVVSPKRDLDLIQVDSLASYMSAFRDAFRSKFPRQAGETGRCKMVSWPDIFIVQVVKQRIEGVLNVERRIVQGTKEMVENLIQKTQGQYCVHRAPQYHLSTTLPSVDTPHSYLTPTRRNLDGRYVHSGLLLHLL